METTTSLVPLLLAEAESGVEVEVEVEVEVGRTVVAVDPRAGSSADAG
jgi:hypothetical protein